MALTQLKIHNLRNLIEAETSPGPRFNVIYGLNGSGKTSMLEGIHYLGLGRSFRTHLNQPLINKDASSFSIFGQVQENEQLVPIGIERQRNGESRIRIQSENVTSPVALAKLLPLQFLDSDAHRLLLGGPKFRRQFIDWGVFHVEHFFLAQWQRATRALKQRNAVLRSSNNSDMLQLWNVELAAAALELDKLRQNYIGQLLALLDTVLKQLLGDNFSIALQYYRGWPQGRELEECLRSSFKRDSDLGYTQYGPHRADLSLKIDNVPAHERLSQGQQKLVVYAMRLAQGILLQQQTGKQCVYLIDDLAAELDGERRERVINILSSLHTQVFITGIEKRDLEPVFAIPYTKLFHVEHGVISAEC